MMKAKNWGILSAFTAAVCCLGPLVLILLGLGGLGLGAVLGKYHWYFILAAGLFLALAWRKYLSEKKACETAHCEMKAKAVTRNILILASAAILTFAGLNFYTYAKPLPIGDIPVSGTQVSIPVEGVSCFTCEIAVESAVKKLPGVSQINASAKEGAALVSYDPQKTSLDQIVQAINQTGYKARKPEL